MYWSEDDTPDTRRISDDVIDILFAIDCKRLPVDHAYALASALQSALPWIAETPGLAVHSIHVAGSQNGWQRPGHGTTSELMVSRRTKLVIRSPSHLAADLMRELTGRRLAIDGHPLVVGQAKLRPLSSETTLLARYLVAGEGDSAVDDEPGFLASAAEGLAALGIRIRKALCGKAIALATPRGAIQTRSLMLAGLTLDESLRLQQLGLGPHRLLGCGIFIPHKGIGAVRPD